MHHQFPRSGRKLWWSVAHSGEGISLLHILHFITLLWNLPQATSLNRSPCSICFMCGLVTEGVSRVWGREPLYLCFYIFSSKVPLWVAAHRNIKGISCVLEGCSFLRTLHPNLICIGNSMGSLFLGIVWREESVALFFTRKSVFLCHLMWTSCKSCVGCVYVWYFVRKVYEKPWTTHHLAVLFMF